jgi:hypothetical protein
MGNADRNRIRDAPARLEQPLSLDVTACSDQSRGPIRRLVLLLAQLSVPLRAMTETGWQNLRKTAYRGGYRDQPQTPERSDTPMSNNRVFTLRQPDTIDDPLTDVLRSGAREALSH